MAERHLTPEVEAGLEDRGPDSVRMLLLSAGPSVGAVVRGLTVRDGSGWISRADAKLWLRQKDVQRANETAALVRRDTIRFRYTIVIGCNGAFAAVVAAIEGLPIHWR